MYTLINEQTDPYFNLALEEYLLKHLDFDQNLFYLWRNEACVIVGRNQNPFAEINLKYAYEHHIPILRRMSGGGCVYHDLGNINFTFITDNSKGKLNNYRYFLEPIISVLKHIGIDATFVEKSHIYMKDHKISGNAQTYYKNKMIHHGTLLFHSNLEDANNVLNRTQKVEGHFVDSTPAPIQNIVDALQIETDILSFMEYLRNELMFHDVKTITLKEEDVLNITELAMDKYHSYEWVYGIPSTFKLIKKEDYILVENGLIKDSSKYQSYLIDKPLDYEYLNETFEGVLEKEDILQYIFE